MRQPLRWFAFLLLCASASTAFAEATTYELSLADDGGRYVVTAGSELDVTFVDRLPGGAYRVEVKRSGLLAPFPLSVFSRESDLDTVPKEGDLCLPLLGDVLSSSSEQEVRQRLAAARASSPDDGCRARIDLLAEVTKSTVPGGPFVLEEGQKIELEVIRTVPSAKTWSFSFAVPASPWRIHYGFSFLPDEDEEYFLKQQEGEESGFVITRSADRKDYQFEPTVTFTYRPRRLAGSSWAPGFLAGLGADIEERLVFAGLAWTIGENVNLFVGAAGHEQDRLRGEYEVGQVLRENLEADQLLDETFDVNWIVGVGFRFGSNPFEKESPAPSPTPNASSDSGTTSNDASGSESEIPEPEIPGGNR